MRTGDATAPGWGSGTGPLSTRRLLQLVMLGALIVCGWAIGSNQPEPEPTGEPTPVLPPLSVPTPPVAEPDDLPAVPVLQPAGDAPKREPVPLPVPEPQPAPVAESPAVPPLVIEPVRTTPAPVPTPVMFQQPAPMPMPLGGQPQPLPMPVPGGGPGSAPLPQPRPAFPDDRIRLPILGNPGTLGTTPVPTEKDLAEARQFIDKVVDPRFTLDLIEGRARLILLKDVPTQVQLADNGIASYNQIQPKQLTILGRRPGTTVLNIWFADPDKKGEEKVLSYLLRVLPDPEAKARLERVYKALEDEVNKFFPNSRVKLQLVGDKLMVTGQAHDIFDATQIMRVIRANAPGGAGSASQVPIKTAGGLAANPDDPTNPTGTAGVESYLQSGGTNVINNLRIPGEHQVMLRVMVAEVNRAAARSIGVNFSINNAAGQQVFAQLTGGVAANLPVNISGGRVPLSINALRTLNYARSLAEPNLVAMNGQTATFLAGGQFPVPVIGGIGAGGGGGLLGGGGGIQGVQFIPFGVQLGFTPIITDRDRVRLTVQSTVSTRDNAAGANIGGAAVPGLNSRTFSTTVEMREGQTLAVAGLIQTNLGTNATRVPFFGDLPFVGRLFGSDQVTSGEQELVVLITPEIVRPLNQNELSPLPGSDVFEPGDLEFYLHGRLESRRSYDYRASVQNDIHKMLRYRRCEQLYLVGPTGHSQLLLSRPLSATVQGR